MTGPQVGPTPVPTISARRTDPSDNLVAVHEVAFSNSRCKSPLRLAALTVVLGVGGGSVRDGARAQGPGV